MWADVLGGPFDLKRVAEAQRSEVKYYRRIVVSGKVPIGI